MFKWYDKNPLADAFFRAAVLVSIIAVTVLLVTTLTVGVSEGILLGLVFLSVAPVLFAIPFRFSDGNASISADGITVSTRFGRHEYDWDHVESVSVRTLDRLGRFWGGILGANKNARFIELQLKRYPRIRLIGGGSATRARGVPMASRRIALWIDKPDEFARLASDQRHRHSV